MAKRDANKEGPYLANPAGGPLTVPIPGGYQHQNSNTTAAVTNYGPLSTATPQVPGPRKSFFG